MEVGGAVWVKEAGLGDEDGLGIANRGFREARIRQHRLRGEP